MVPLPGTGVWLEEEPGHMLPACSSSTLPTPRDPFPRAEQSGLFSSDPALSSWKTVDCRLRRVELENCKLR